MGVFLREFGIYRRDWQLMELENGEPLYEYSAFRYQTVLITMTSGRVSRIEVIPLYMRKTR